MERITIRLSEEDIVTLEKLKLEMKAKSMTDVIRNLIINTRQDEKGNSNDTNSLFQIKKDCSLTLALLKQFYGEMTSFKEYNPKARECEKLKQFLNDYYSPEDKFMK